MNRVKSFYLECLRVFAAFYVFIYHVSSETIHDIPYLSNQGFASFLHLNYSTAHCFVMIFFVLSGYLITMSASKPGITFRVFITNRLGRLYSVLIPSLLFSFLLAYFFKFSSYDIGRDIENLSLPLQRGLLNLFFLGQAYTLCSVPPFNGAFWSVQYEFIYYLFIGVFITIRNWWKYLILFVLLFISWIKILMLFPVWLMGSCLYYIEKKYKMKMSISIIIFFVSLGYLIYYLSNSSSMPFQKNTSDNHLFSYHLFLSWNFRADYLFAIVLFVNMFSLFQISEAINKKIGNTNWFKSIYEKSNIVGNCTYTLYLFHTPLLFFFATVLPYDRFNNFHVLGVIFLVIISVYLIARLTEWKVLFWRNNISSFFKLFVK